MPPTKRIHVSIPNAELDYLLKLEWRTSWEKSRETKLAPATVIARAVSSYVEILKEPPTNP